MMWIIEIGEDGFHSDRLVELINYCVAGDGAREKREICFRDARVSASHESDPGALALSSMDYPCGVQGIARGKVH